MEGHSIKNSALKITGQLETFTSAFPYSMRGFFPQVAEHRKIFTAPLNCIHCVQSQFLFSCRTLGSIHVLYAHESVNVRAHELHV